MKIPPKPRVEIPPRPKSRKGPFQYTAQTVDKKFLAPIMEASISNTLDPIAESEDIPSDIQVNGATADYKEQKTPNFKQEKALLITLQSYKGSSQPSPLASSQPSHSMNKILQDLKLHKLEQLQIQYDHASDLLMDQQYINEMKSKKVQRPYFTAPVTEPSSPFKSKSATGLIDNLTPGLKLTGGKQKSVVEPIPFKLPQAHQSAYVPKKE